MWDFLRVSSCRCTASPECSAGSGKALCCKRIPWNDPHIVHARELSAKIIYHRWSCFPPKQTCLLPPVFKRCRETCSGINVSLTFWRIDEFTALVQLLNTIFFVPFTVCLVPMWLWSGVRLIRLLTVLSEVSPLGPGLGLLLSNVWQDLITCATVFRHPRFPH